MKDDEFVRSFKILRKLNRFWKRDGVHRQTKGGVGAATVGVAIVILRFYRKPDRKSVV